MFAPRLLAWMKEWSDLVVQWINSRQIRTFPQIAINAGRGQIREIVCTAMLARNNMFHLQWSQGRILLMALAILAPLAGTFKDESTCGGGSHGALEMSRRRAIPCNTATRLLART